MSTFADHLLSNFIVTVVIDEDRCLIGAKHDIGGVNISLYNHIVRHFLASLRNLPPTALNRAHMHKAQRMEMHKNSLDTGKDSVSSDFWNFVIVFVYIFLKILATLVENEAYHSVIASQYAMVYRKAGMRVGFVCLQNLDLFGQL